MMKKTCPVCRRRFYPYQDGAGFNFCTRHCYQLWKKKQEKKLRPKVRLTREQMKNDAVAKLIKQTYRFNPERQKEMLDLHFKAKSLRQ